MHFREQLPCRRDGGRFGAFGILDSSRADVKYEDRGGHKLDRAMLEVLRSFKS